MRSKENTLLTGGSNVWDKLQGLQFCTSDELKTKKTSRVLLFFFFLVLGCEQCVP